MYKLHIGHKTVQKYGSSLLDNTTLHFHISLTIPLILVMTELQKMIQNITVIKKLQSVNPENIAVNTAALKCM